MAELNIIVGGNGSGKSTFYYTYLQHSGMPFYNADELAKNRWPNDPESHSYEAAKEVEKMRDIALINRDSFCFETVFSHVSKVDFIARAKSMGFTINMFVIHIDEDPMVNIARVAERKDKGGHGVPPEKITTRIPRMLANVTLAVPLCDTVSFYDNSSATHPFKVIGVLKVNSALHYQDDMPDWVKKCVGNNYKIKIQGTL